MSDRTIGVGILGTGFARSTQIPVFQALKPDVSHISLVFARVAPSPRRSVSDAS
jgi:hypothetical protein